MTEFKPPKHFKRTYCPKRKAEFINGKRELVPGVDVMAWEKFVSSLPIGEIKITDKWEHCYIITKRSDNFISMVKGD